MQVEVTLYVEGRLMDRSTREAPCDLPSLEQMMSELGPRHTELAAGRPWYTDFRFTRADTPVQTLRVTPAPSGENYFVSTVEPEAPAIAAAVKAPGFWTNEKTGRLRPVVMKYLNGRRLSDYELAVMRVYLRQWIFNEAWHPCPALTELRRQVPLIQTHEALAVWLENALEIGIDPL